MKSRWFSLFAVSAGVALASCGTAATSSSITIASAPGVTATSILLGTVTNLSGPNATVNRQIVAGERAVFRAVNSYGGIDGRRLTLEVENDQGTPTGEAEALRSLADQAGVFAYVGNGALSTSSQVTGSLESLGVPSLLPVDSYPPGTTSASFSATVALQPPPAAQPALALSSLSPVPHGTAVGVLISPGVGLSKVKKSIGKLVPGSTITTIEETGTSQSESTAVDEIIGDQIQDLVSFVSVNQTVAILASLPATRLPSKLVLSTDAPSTSGFLSRLSGAHVSTANLSVTRVSAIPGLSSLTGAWRSDILRSRAKLSTGIPLSGATYEGMVVGWGAVGLITDAGRNPTRLVLLTRAGRSSFIPPLPVAGTYVMADGPSSGFVLSNVSHDVLGKKVTGTPPRFAVASAKA